MNTSRKNKIGLVCPFCAATENDYDRETGLRGVQLNVSASRLTGRDMFWASCNVCGASGPLCDDALDARARFAMTPYH